MAPARAWLTKPYSKENLSSMKPTTREKLAHTGRIRFTSSCRDTSSDSSMVKGGSVVCAREGFRRAYLPSVPCGINVKYCYEKSFQSSLPHTNLKGNGPIVEYSPHSVVLQKTAVSQTKTLTLMSVNKT